MGGKTKQSQRTKNNTRPSSSSRSAELLSNAASVDGGLVSLSTGKVLPALFPTLAATNYEQGLQPEFQMCIKKLNKKDPITKTKALQELCELVNNGNVDDVVAALPSWAHFYKILTVDTDRKVREMAQVCHLNIMRACGRRVAPHLKQLLPSWLQAQYDEHAPAMTAAQTSLASTFPDSKLPEVISFCKVEVMAHLTDNLIGNAEAIISKKTESAEERELQACRVVSSSLQGLEFLLRRLPADQAAWLWPRLLELLRHRAFWAAATHSAHQVRAAWFGACGSVAERYGGGFGSEFGAKTLRLLLSAAEHRQPAVAPHVWTCLLLLMHGVQGWETYLDKRDLLTRRILDVLENGGWGDARHLSDILLPLLAHLPRDMLTKHFYETFFTAIFIGLEKKNILSSKSERQSWITSLAECLRYLSVRRDEFVVSVATGVHRTWLEKVFAQPEGQTKTNLIKWSAANVASILKYWLKQSKEDDSEKYDQLVRNFWQNIGSTLLIEIEKSSAEPGAIGKLIEGHVLFLQTLKTSFAQEAHHRQSIKFDGDRPAVPAPTAEPAQRCDASIAERYKHNLDELVHDICATYFQFAVRNEVSDGILPSLITLLVEFDSKNLYEALARQFEVDTVYKFYDKVLKSWLAADTMRCEAVVDIAFLSMEHMTEEEQDTMFNSFEQFPVCVEEWALGACVSRGNSAARRWARGDSAARRWARGPRPQRAVAALAQRAARDQRASRLLRLLLTADGNGEVLVNNAAVASVVRAFTAAVSDLSGPTLEGSCEFAAGLVGSLPHTDDEHYSELVHALFRLTLLVPCGDARLSAAAWRGARDAWRAACGAMSAERRHVFRAGAARLLRARRADTAEDPDPERLERVASPCPHLLGLGEGSPPDAADVAAFTALLFDAPADSGVVRIHALRHECVASGLNCLDENDGDDVRAVIERSSDPDVGELTRADFAAYASELLFRATYLRTVLLHGVAAGGRERTRCDALLNDDYLGVEFCKVIYDCAIVNSLHEAYPFWPHYEIIEKTKRKLDSLLSDILRASSADARIKISGTMSRLSAERGYHWAYGRRWLQLQLHMHPADAADAARANDTSTPHDDNIDVVKLEDVLSGAGFFHNLQANAKWPLGADRAYETKYLVMLRSFYAAHADVLHEEFAHDVARCQASCDLDVIINGYYRYNDIMLYERDITEAPWLQVLSNTAILEFLAAMVPRCGWLAPAHHWDFTTITVCSLLNSLDKSKRNWGCTKVAMLGRAALRLLAAVAQFCGGLRQRCRLRQPAPHVAALAAEWRDVFLPDCLRSLLGLLLHVLDRSAGAALSAGRAALLHELAAASALLRHCGAAPRALCLRAAAALGAPLPAAYKCVAYAALDALAAPLVLEDAEKLSQWSEDSQDGDEEKQRPEFSLDYFHDTFEKLREIVEAALSNVELGEETCEMVAHSDSHSMALGWLLLAELMAKLCTLARGDLVHHQIQIYRDRKYAEPLLTTSLRLLPAEVFAYAQENANDAPVPAQYADMFLGVERLSVYEAGGGAAVGALACRCLYTAVCGAGCHTARGWSGAAGGRAARLLERLLRAYVSPHAAASQLSELRSRAAEIADAEVRVARSSREVTCVFRVEERDVELRVALSRSHPLRPPRVSAPHAQGPGANTHWLALYLAYQNGTLLNALKMWTRAVSARVESAPQCYICYCRLHPGSGRLPRVACHQCHNKFHSACLRKWFTTSNKSSCPLCRSAF